MKKGSFLLTIGMLVMVLVGAYTGYLYFRGAGLDAEIQRLEQLVSEQKVKIVEYEGENLESALVAKDELAGLETSAVKWSEVIIRILETMPRREGSALVNVLSYSGVGGDELNLSLRTVGGSRAPYFDVAQLISAFDGSKYFIDPFVPSVASSQDEDGQEILSFNLSVKYNSEGVAESSEELGAAIEDVLSESLDVEETPAPAEPISR